MDLPYEGEHCEEIRNRNIQEAKIHIKVSKDKLPFIIKAFESFYYHHNPMKRSLVLIMDFAENGSLEDFKGMKKELSRNLFIQAVQGVQALHYHGVYHLDLKVTFTF